MVDTAAVYLNKRAVGASIRDSPVDHQDVFVTIKLWMTQYDGRARAGTPGPTHSALPHTPCAPDQLDERAIARV